MVQAIELRRMAMATLPQGLTFSRTRHRAAAAAPAVMTAPAP